MVVQEVVQVMAEAEDLEGLEVRVEEQGMLDNKMHIPQVIQVLVVLLVQEGRQEAAQDIRQQLDLVIAEVLVEEAQAQVMTELTGLQLCHTRLHLRLVLAQLAVIAEEAEGEGELMLNLVLQAPLQILPEPAEEADQDNNTLLFELAQEEEVVA